MGTKFLLREGGLDGTLQRNQRTHGELTRTHDKWLPGLARKDHVKGAEVSGLESATVRLAETPVQFRIIGFPDPVTHLETGRIKMSVAEVVTILPDLIDPPTLLLIGVGSGIKDNPVPGLERCLRIESDEVGSNPGNGSKEGSPLLSKAGMDQFLMIHTMHPAGVETAGKSHLELVAILIACFARMACQSSINRLPIDLANRRHILGSLESSLDLETLHTGSDQLRDIVHRGEILRREKVALIPEIPQRAVNDEFVGHTASLGALTAVGTTLPERFAGQALARVGNTESAMDEDFERHAIRIEALQLPEREFTGQHGTGDPEPPCNFHALRRGQCHLR